MFRWFSQCTYYGPHDITNARKCNPHLKDWEEWLNASGWTGPTEGEGEGKGEEKSEAVKARGA